MHCHKSSRDKKSYKSKSHLNQSDSSLNEKKNREKLIESSDALSQSTNQYFDLQNKYQNLFSDNLSPQENYSNAQEDYDSFTECSNQQAEIELQQWGQTWNRLVSMITRYVPMPTVTIVSNDDKRNILISLTSQLCNLADNYLKTSEIPKKIHHTDKDYMKLQKKCQSLLDEVQQNYQSLDVHLKQAKNDDSKVFSDKIQEFTDMTKELIRNQRNISIQNELILQPQLDQRNYIPSHNHSYHHPHSNTTKVHGHRSKRHSKTISDDKYSCHYKSKFEKEDHKHFHKNSNNNIFQLHINDLMQATREVEDDYHRIRNYLYKNRNCSNFDEPSNINDYSSNHRSEY